MGRVREDGVDQLAEPAGLVGDHFHLAVDVAVPGTGQQENGSQWLAQVVA